MRRVGCPATRATYWKKLMEKISMRKTLTLTAVLLALGSAMPAFAEEDANCTVEPRDKWMSTDEATAKAQDQGYEVRRVKVEGSCYEVYGFDKEKARVEVYMDPVSGKILPGAAD
jgi:hypothetical protein